jgi:hypothetical protein
MRSMHHMCQVFTVKHGKDARSETGKTVIMLTILLLAGPGGLLSGEISVL